MSSYWAEDAILPDVCSWRGKHAANRGSCLKSHESQIINTPEDQPRLQISKHRIILCKNVCLSSTMACLHEKNQALSWIFVIHHTISKTWCKHTRQFKLTDSSTWEGARMAEFGHLDRLWQDVQNALILICQENVIWRLFLMLNLLVVFGRVFGWQNLFVQTDTAMTRQTSSPSHQLYTVKTMFQHEAGLECLKQGSDTSDHHLNSR